MRIKNKIFFVLLLTLTVVGGGVGYLSTLYSNTDNTMKVDSSTGFWISPQDVNTPIPPVKNMSRYKNKAGRQAISRAAGNDMYASGDYWTVPSNQTRTALLEKNEKRVSYSRKATAEEDLYSSSGTTSGTELLVYSRGSSRNSAKDGGDQAGLAASASLAANSSLRVPFSSSNRILVDPEPGELQENDQIGYQVPIGDGLTLLILLSVLYAVIRVRKFS